MATTLPTIKIAQSGSSGSYSYSVTGGYSQGANCPIFAVSWGDAARFCNWLQNGQPTGAEGNATTETGAYTLNGDTTNLMTETRNTGAKYFIPSENEWYKAAYYKGGSTNAGYWFYETQSNNAPGNTLPDAGNSANYDPNYEIGGFTDPTNYLTPVGAFSNSPGAYGTFDMGGDVWQWDETNIAGSSRGLRGGFYGSSFSEYLGASTRVTGYSPAIGYFNLGFRVASLAVPEPGSIMLVVAGGLCLAAYAWRRRRV